MVKGKCLGIRTRGDIKGGKENRRKGNQKYRYKSEPREWGRYYFLLSLEEKMKRLNTEMELRSRCMYQMALTQYK